MDGFDEALSSSIGGCLVAIVIGVFIIGGLYLIGSHIQWK